MVRVIAFGECMVELSLSAPDAADIGYAGDTFNTAVYMSRLGRRVAYATALGEGDRFSRGILDKMAGEGIDTDLVVGVAGRLPGLYAIDRDPSGERTFSYWRSEAPVREFFQFADLDRLTEECARAELVYLSGISLAVVGEAGRERLLDLVSAAARAGTPVAFDPNYRPRLWASPETARSAIEAIVGHCRFISFSSADIQALFPGTALELGQAWAESGAEVVQRDEDQWVRVHEGDRIHKFPPVRVETVVDTTGAGDSFNAAYLATRLAGDPIEAAVAAAQQLASRVVGFRGAILPRGAASGEEGA